MQFNALITLLSPASNFKSKSSSGTVCVGFLWRKKSLQNTFSDETLNDLFNEGKIRGFRCIDLFFLSDIMCQWLIEAWTAFLIDHICTYQADSKQGLSMHAQVQSNVGKENIHLFKSHIVSCKFTNRFKLAWAMLSELSELLISVQLFWWLVVFRSKVLNGLKSLMIARLIFLHTTYIYMSLIFIVYTCKTRIRMLCTCRCLNFSHFFLVHAWLDIFPELSCLQYALGMIISTTIMPSSIYWYTLT